MKCKHIAEGIHCPLGHFIKKDRTGRNEWIPCPECEGYKSKGCPHCKGWGVIRGGKK